MSDDLKKNASEQQDPASGNTGKEEYRFLDQKIKRRPINKKTWLMRILGIIGAGVAIGLIASLVFGLMHPELRKAKNAGEESSAKITIPADEEPEKEETPTPTPTPEATPTPTPEPTETPETTEEPVETEAPEEPETTSTEEGEGEETGEGTEEETDPAQEPGAEEAGAAADILTLDEYKKIHREMLIVAGEAERSMVQVIGITDEMDYFDQGYENQRRVAGTAVAMNDTDLFILTEYRVVEQVERIQVVFCDGSMTDATFQRSDPETGLAVLKVPLASITEETKNELQVATLGNSYLIYRGDPVMAIGSPMGYTDSIAFGVITSASRTASAVDREYRLFTTDIEGSSESSGVLIDLNGQIIGILTHAFGAEDRGLIALSLSEAKELIQDLSNNEGQTYIGIYGQNVTQEITDRTGIPRGVLVN